MSLMEAIDPDFLRSCLQKISDASGTADGAPPAKGMLLLGFDGTVARRVRTDADGYLLIKSV